jgi:uncharacterized protein (TIGR03435 family)
LLRAWNLKGPQLSGTASLATERYDIVAKIPPGTTRDQLNLMIQALLIERLTLSFHWDTRFLPAYELNVAKGGHQLKVPAAYVAAPQTSDSTLTLTGGGAEAINLIRDKFGNPQLPPGRKNLVMIPLNGYTRVSARMQEMSDILQMMEGQSDREFVLDRTGLTGAYDFTLDFSRDRPRLGPEDSSSPLGAPLPGLGPSTDPAPTFMEAIVQQLGLRLVPINSPTPVMVVDGFSKEPKGN